MSAKANPHTSHNEPDVMRILLVDDDADDLLLIREYAEEGFGDGAYDCPLPQGEDDGAGEVPNEVPSEVHNGLASPLAMVGPWPQHVELDEAASFDEAARKLAVTRYDACIVDYRLGAHDGLELIELIRAQDPLTPVIVLTGHADHQTAVNALKAGATDYLVKSSLTPEALCTSLRAALRLATSEKRRLAVEWSLRESESILASTFEVLTDYLTVLDTKMQVVKCNWQDVGPREFQCTDVMKCSEFYCENCAAKEVFECGESVLREEVDEDGRIFEAHYVPIHKSDSSNVTMGGLSGTAAALGEGAREVALVVKHSRDVTEEHENRNKVESYQDKLQREVDERTGELKTTLLLVRESQLQMNAVIASIPQAIAVVDQEGRVMLLNAQFEPYISVKRRLAYRKPLVEVLHADVLSREVVAEFERACTQSDHCFGFTLNTSEDEEHIDRHFQVKASPFTSHKGDEQGVVIVLDDVTAERHVDVQMSRMKDEFISTAAHELRTPLTTIIGFLELLITRKDLSDQQRGEFLDMVSSNASTLNTILSDLLDITRMESGEALLLDVSQFDIALMLREKVAVAHKYSPAHNVTLQAEPSAIRLYADAGRIAQVLDNLLSNAIKYSPDGGEIAVHASLRPAEDTATLEDAREEVLEGEVEVRIRDTGLGMNEEEVERIFEKFYRGHAKHGSSPGTGLGMSIVRDIVELHGGTIHVASTKGEGTTVTLRLPTAPPAPRNLTLPEPPAPA